MCFLSGVFERKLCHWQITLGSRIGITIQFSTVRRTGYTKGHILSGPPHFPFLLCVREKNLHSVWLAIVQSLTFSPPPSSLPAPLVSSMHAITVLHWESGWKRERREEWRTGKVMSGLEDKNQADFYLGWAPGRLLLPSNQEGRDEGCKVAAQIDSRHNLLLSALAQPILFPQRHLLLVKNTACHFWCHYSMQPHFCSHNVSLFFKLKCCLAVWSHSGPLQLVAGMWKSCWVAQ